jgi:glycosyltransferase involved in cell wall biosynthesis
MSALVHLPYGDVLDACYEAWRAGDSTPLKYVVTKISAHLAFRSGSKSLDRTERESVRLPEFTRNDLPSPAILTVVVPVFVRDERGLSFFLRLLKSLDEQTTKADHIVIVDDASPCSYELDSDRYHHVRLDANVGPATARNRGKAVAMELGSDLIAFIDSDCIAGRDWIESIQAGFASDEHASVLSGRTLSHNRGWLGEYHDLDGTLNGRRFLDSDFLLYGVTANLAITAEVSRSVNFCEDFPDAAAEDIDFSFRAISAGFGIRHAERMVVDHDYGYGGGKFGDFVRFLKQFKRYGRGERRLLEQVPNFYAYHAASVSIRNKSIAV